MKEPLALQRSHPCYFFYTDRRQTKESRRIPQGKWFSDYSISDCIVVYPSTLQRKKFS
jgi:hypothetical protein